MNVRTDIAKYSFLVVDDDVVTRKLLSSMLQKMGAASVDVADDGVTAVNQMESAKKLPDIIICDLNMPEMDGVELLRYFAERHFSGGVILISSAAIRMLRIVVNLAQAHHLNVLGALSKPLTPEALLDILSRFSGEQQNSVHRQVKEITAAELDKALDEGRIVPFFQPKVSMTDGSVVGLEVLARWQHPERGLIPPSMFIPLAEQNGLINKLTWTVFSNTVREVSTWRKNGDFDFSVSFNISTRSLTDVDLPDRLEAELHESALQPSDIMFEITESCLMEHDVPSLETLIRLRLKGFGLSIDDFGTGRSSMEQLHRIPFAELKVDRLFVSGAEHNDEGRMFFESAVSIARNLGLSVVAEGVENQSDWDMCAKLGCDSVQGYFIARPMPANEFWLWCRNWQKFIDVTENFTGSRIGHF